jgi:hypothetical protein
MAKGGAHFVARIAYDGFVDYADAELVQLAG